MSTDMDEVKLYAETVAGDLSRRAASIEKLNASFGTDSGVIITPPAARHIANLIENMASVASRLERLADAERLRAEAAERAALIAMDLVEKSR